MAARPPIPASQAGLMVLVFTLCVLAGAALVFLMPGGYQARAVLPPLPPSVIARLTAEPLLARVAARVGPGRLAPAVAAALGKDLRVRPESGRVVLRYTHDDPEVARAVLTALLQVAEDRHALLVGPAQVRLLEARDQAAARLVGLRRQLAALRNGDDGAVLGQVRQAFEGRSRALRAAFAAAGGEAARLRDAQGGQAGRQPWLAAALAATYGRGAVLATQLAEAEATLAALDRRQRALTALELGVTEGERALAEAEDRLAHAPPPSSPIPAIPDIKVRRLLRPSAAATMAVAALFGLLAAFMVTPVLRRLRSHSPSAPGPQHVS